MDAATGLDGGMDTYKTGGGMTARNDITGDAIATKPASEAYRERWDRVFRNKMPCPRCFKVNAADIHTCTPPAVRDAQQRLTDLAQAEGFGLCDKCDPDQCCRL